MRTVYSRTRTGYNLGMTGDRTTRSPPSGRMPPAHVGILGAGQLGLMTILAGRPLGFTFTVLADAADDPATSVADHVVVGSRYSALDLATVTAACDVTTYEIEHIDAAALIALEAGGAAIRPSPRVLALIQDKLAQKEALSAAGVPVPRFDAAVLPPAGESAMGYPCVQKLRRGGYDGRGVKVLRGAADELLSGESYYEELVPLEQEIAVLVARSASGETVVYPPVSMQFDERANICSNVVMPAVLAAPVAERAREIALAAVEALEPAVVAGVARVPGDCLDSAANGVFAVELFLAADGRLLVNEIAPRPHNSGHITIEACRTSQFEQHLRAIAGLPLGPVDLIQPAAMLNLLGAPDASGQPVMPGYDELLAIPGAHIHWYQKRTVHPFRKMGHLTVTAADAGAVTELVERTRPYLDVAALMGRRQQPQEGEES